MARHLGGSLVESAPAKGTVCDDRYRTRRPHLRGRPSRTGGLGHRAPARGRGLHATSLFASREQLDLRDQAAVNYWFRANRPEYVFLVAGTVGGIMANSTRPAEFLYDNMMIHATVVHAAHLFDVRKLLYLGSSLHLPARCADQPITEDAAAHRPARADQRGLRAGQDRRHQALRRVPRPVRLRLHLGHAHQPLRARTTTSTSSRSHVLPALMRKFHDAQAPAATTVSRSGERARRVREFLHVDDLADACLFLMRHYDDAGPINVGTGDDITIRELAEMVRDIVYPEAELRLRHHQARRHAPQGARRLAAARARLAGQHRACATASPAPTSGSSTTRVSRSGGSSPPSSVDGTAVPVSGTPGATLIGRTRESGKPD